MNIIKVIQDQAIKRFFGKGFVPGELLELNQYFRLYDPINFEYSRSSDGNIIAKSTNFRYGSIITSGKDMKDVDKNVEDAILTSFEIPSAYTTEVVV